jgi:predicted Zn-dependent protease
MKKTWLAIALLTFTAPAYAQLGGLTGALKKAQDSKQKIDDLTFSEAEERQIGDQVSAKIRERFGVVQDAAVHKYVALVGGTLAKASDRPNLAWTFVVLDTDGVNAFAAPGGIVHITRGALGLIRNEAELAGVLGHEIGHVTRKHTINAIQKNKAVQLGASAARSDVINRTVNAGYEMVLENSFDRGDELDADKVSVGLAQKAGYASGSLAEFLRILDERNKDQAEKNGLFASHPETKERMDKIRQQEASSKSAALVDARYKSNIKYVPTPIASIATAEGSTSTAATAEPAKKGFGLDALKKTVAPEKESTQVSASGGVRGLGRDRAAKGGSNPGLVRTSVTAAELATFAKGIV